MYIIFLNQNTKMFTVNKNINELARVSKAIIKKDKSQFRKYEKIFA